MATILLVEDDRWLGDCYQSWLKSFGYKVVLATDAQAALDELDHRTINLVLLDIILPFSNGIQLLNTMASHADFKDVPVVICSSLTPNLPTKNYRISAVLDKTTLTRAQLQKTLKQVLIAPVKKRQSAPV